MGRAARLKQERRQRATEVVQAAAGRKALLCLRQELARESRLQVEETPAPQSKVSDALEALVQPWLSRLVSQRIGGTRAMTDVLLLGCLAWNAHAFADRPGDEPTELLALLVRRATRLLDELELLGDDGEDLAQELLARKWSLFPEDRRVLLRLVVEQDSPGWAGIAVAATDSRGDSAMRAARLLGDA